MNIESEVARYPCGTIVSATSRRGAHRGAVVFCDDRWVEIRERPDDICTSMFRIEDINSEPGEYQLIPIGPDNIFN